MIRALRRLRIGSRTSPLALKQVDEVAEALRAAAGCAVETVGCDTAGDRDRTTSLVGLDGTDFFTDAIDRSLLDGEIDIALHSAKDLPDPLPEGLLLAALTRGVDSRDVFIGPCGLDAMPVGARIGTSSERRRAMLAAVRPDLVAADIRGNVDDRIAQLDRGEYDGLILG